MADTQLLEKVKKRANDWLNSSIDEASKDIIRNLLANNEKDLIESFYKDLEFGTGGMRGIMGVGTNRINIYTIGMATQGLANYLLKVYQDKKVKVCIAYDSRNNSEKFARYAADVLAGNNIKTYLFESLRPTPELSFAVRELNCQSGIVITASHNPKEYNGYKVYWEDGGQIIAPHDQNIISEVNKINNVGEIKVIPESKLVELIGSKIDKKYIDKIKKISINPGLIKKNQDLKIVYTPLHGTGCNIIPAAFKSYGFSNVHLVSEQSLPDGNFPTVKSPNPEEPAALEMAINKAKELDAELVLATDPDSDRVGIAVKENEKNFRLLNGNQTATLIIYYILHHLKEQKKLKGNEYIVKTIVTTDLLTEIAQKYEVDSYEVLTGFKYIADKIKEFEIKKRFIAGGEESYGYLVDTFVRDKDAVISCMIIAEIAVWLKETGKSFMQILKEIYLEFGFYKEELISLKKEGKDGAEQIKSMMENFRTTPPQSINRSDVLLIHDYLKQKTIDMISDLRYDISLPKSNVLQFILKDGSKISVRPSGTEPKIKFYFSVKEELKKIEDFENTEKLLEERIVKLKEYFLDKK